MNEKDLREIRRRFRPDRNNIAKIKGCIVNGEGKIVTKITQSMLTGESSVAERLLGVMKKPLSGKLGTNLTDVEYSTKQVAESERHRLLMRLRDSELEDEEALGALFERIAASLKLDSGYAILLGSDIYDVPGYSKDGTLTESCERFSYIICAICALKTLPEAITLGEGDGKFHLLNVSGALGACELGFMFPAFDERRTNIYGALLYRRNLGEAYPEFCEEVLDCEGGLSPNTQRAAFSECLASSLGEELTLEVISSLYKQVEEIEEEARAEKTGEPLTLAKDTLRNMLGCCGVGEDKLDALSQELDESFGKNVLLTPRNIVKTSRFDITSPEVSVKVSPEHRDLVTTQTIGGVKYLMIRVDGGIEVNGININLNEE